MHSGPVFVFSFHKRGLRERQRGECKGERRKQTDREGETERERSLDYFSLGSCIVLVS